MSERKAGCGVALRPIMGKSVLNLRGDPADRGFRWGVAAGLGLNPPTAPCTFHSGRGRALYWLGPDEWLALAPSAAADPEAALREAIDERFSVVDVSGGYALFNLAGPQAGEVLRKSSPYDFHPSAFAPGRCVQTVFAKAAALVAANADGGFDLMVRSSYAAYLRRWIADAAAEYGFDGGGGRIPPQPKATGKPL